MHGVVMGTIRKAETPRRQTVKLCWSASKANMSTGMWCENILQDHPKITTRDCGRSAIHQVRDRQSIEFCNEFATHGHSVDCGKNAIFSNMCTAPEQGQQPDPLFTVDTLFGESHLSARAIRETGMVPFKQWRGLSATHTSGAHAGR